MPEKGVLAGLSDLKQVPGRLERVDAGQDFSVFVDYAHTDSALRTVLSYLARLPHKRLIAVFGCGGDRDRTKRGPMGVAACEIADLAVVTSDNPRTENALDIIGDIEKAILEAGFKNYKVEPDRRRAIALAIAQARAGDIVVIAGKGHEDYQLVGTASLPFDDRLEARAALKLAT
jgi:UDP-N-acetylmuramoyl-L-alanyl-D-glutamate--2,6-diaminopimelate ligase